MTKGKSFFVFATAVLLIIFSAGVYAGTYSDGTGEPNDPYLIATAEDMNEIGADSNDWDKHFLMVDDINLADYNGTEFNIIGNLSKSFTGVFDGNNHKIYNFSYQGAGSRIGIFGYVSSNHALIKDVTLIDPNIKTSGSRVGSLVGDLNRGTVSDCGVDGCRVQGTDNVGGLVGFSFYDGEISNCYAAGYVLGSNFYAGGLLGTNDGMVSNCYAKTLVSGQTDTANLVGHNCHGIVSNCYATGSVSGYWMT